jgi:hypothetical protein
MMPSRKGRKPQSDELPWNGGVVGEIFRPKSCRPRTGGKYMVNSVTKLVSCIKSSRLASASVISSGLLVLAATVALASIPDSSGVIHGCFLTQNGQLRVIDPPTQQCLPSETAISWNQIGPQGPAGPPGPPGPPGAPGSGGGSNGFVTGIRSGTITSTPSAILTLTLPAGSYMLNASVFVSNSNSGTLGAPILCWFSPATEGGLFAITLTPFVSGAIPTAGTVPMTDAVTLGSTGPVKVICQDNAGPGASANIGTAQMTASQIATLTPQ